MVETKKEVGNLQKVKVTARRISFLMPHQTVLPDLKELSIKLYPLGDDPEKIDRDSSAYLLGAFEALTYLIQCLEEKGPQHKE